MSSINQAQSLGAHQVSKDASPTLSGTPPAVLAPAAGASPPTMTKSPSTATVEIPLSSSGVDNSSSEIYTSKPAYRRGPREDDDRKVFVGNISSKTTEKELSAYFETVGKVESAKIIYPNNRGNRRFAFVVFETQDSQKEAVVKLNESALDESNLTVQVVVQRDHIRGRNITDLGRPQRRPRLSRNQNNEIANSETLEGTIVADDSQSLPLANGLFRTRRQRYRKNKNREPKSDISVVESDQVEEKNEAKGTVPVQRQTGQSTQRREVHQRRNKIQNEQQILNEENSSVNALPNGEINVQHRTNKTRSQNNRNISPNRQNDNEGKEEEQGNQGRQQRPRRNFNASKNNDSSYRRDSWRPLRVRSETGIFVANINYDATDEEFQKLFNSRDYVVAEAYIAREATGRSKGFAFVEFMSHEDQQRALSELTGIEFSGRTISVRVALKQVENETATNEPINSTDADHLVAAST